MIPASRLKSPIARCDREELRRIKIRQQLTAAEADAFEARFEKVEKDVIVKGHDEVGIFLLPSP